MKRIITSGCSFSDSDTPFVWPNLLEKHIKKLSTDVTFDHRGLSSQGQQLIQKKVIHAIHKAFTEGYKPEDICVMVMWSGHERRSWYIDEPDAIGRIINHWNKKETISFQLQFGDLENKADYPTSVGDFSKLGKKYIPYNKLGGWYIGSRNFDELDFFKEYFMLSMTVESIILSLENILMLQSFCKSHNIKLYEQFYMDYVYDLIEGHKTHKEVKHLYDLIDWNNYVSTKSIHGYLKEKEVVPDQYFQNPGDNHPNLAGHLVWTDEVLFPHLEKTNFYNGFLNGQQRTRIV